MGGRDKHLHRVVGKISPKGFYADGYFATTIDGGKTVHVKVMQKKPETTGEGLFPTYSNSPKSIYAEKDKQTGKIKRIRLFDENKKAFLDFDYQPVKTGGPKKLHWHSVDYDKAVKGKKNQTGRSPDHKPVTAEIWGKYKNVIRLLDENPDNQETYTKRK